MSSMETLGDSRSSLFTYVDEVPSPARYQEVLRKIEDSEDAGVLYEEKRDDVTWQVAKTLLPLMNEEESEWERKSDRAEACVELMERVLGIARESMRRRVRETDADREVVEEKKQEWIAFGTEVKRLLGRRKSALASMSAQQMRELLNRYALA